MLLWTYSDSAKYLFSTIRHLKHFVYLRIEHDRTWLIEDNLKKFLMKTSTFEIVYTLLFIVVIKMSCSWKLKLFICIFMYKY